ncbi:hypothetical protein RZE82_08050 [Mollicutes bacterium LVI A0039]|nr:hypothetical protein RZE82_08050 [Mollicutes bacterium LVI A0039]
MSKTNTISVILTVIVLFASVISLALIIAQKNYKTDVEIIKAAMIDQTISSFISDERIEEPYYEGLEEQTIVYSPLCVDCADPIANMHNRGTLVVQEAPKSYCDLDVEQCILYEFDPFGLGIYTKQELIRTIK